jgi:carbamoyl-phosphate synthase large subunit
MPRKRNKILITSAGTNGVNVINALKGEEISVADVNELSAGLYFAKKKYTVPKATDQFFMTSMMYVLKNAEPEIIIPTHSDDILVFAEFKKGLEEIGFKMALSEPTTYIRTENKVDCQKELKDLGIPVPEIYETPKYPCIIKPIKGSGTKDTYKLKTEEDYNYWKKIPNHFLSEYVEGDEYTIGGVSDLDGKFIACLPCKRIKVKNGMSVIAEGIKDEKLEELSKKIAEHFKMVGAWNIQFKGGKCIDVNNRFPSGTMPLLVKSGLNQARIIVDLLNGKKPKVKVKYGLRMTRYQQAFVIDKDYNIL